jgi:hypothetical protein
MENKMIGIRFCPVSAARARGIVAGRAKGRIAFEGSEHGADLFNDRNSLLPRFRSSRARYRRGAR